MKKILVTGASGSVGFQAVKELLRRNGEYQIRALSLGTNSERKLFQPFREKVEIWWGDIRNADDVYRVVDGVDAILHVAGIIPPIADKNPDLAKAVNIGGTKNLVNACLRQINPPKIIFTSSISVYGDRLINPEIVVGDPLNPSQGDVYAWTKIEAENIIRTSGLPYSIFRLCGILVKRLKIQPLMFHMPLDTALEWCHEADAGYALVQGIEQEAITDRIFNLGGGETCRVKAREFLKQMFPLWGLDANILPEYAFATRNFHSGFYVDGDGLDDLLHFRRNSLVDYLNAMRSRIHPITRLIVKRLPHSLIRKWMLRMSEPLKAVRENNAELVNRYYGSREAFDSIYQRSSLRAG